MPLCPQSVLVDRRRQAELEAKGWRVVEWHLHYVEPDTLPIYSVAMVPPADEPGGDLRPVSEVIAGWTGRR